MNRATIAAVLWLFVLPLFCSGTLFAQNANGDREKPKKPGVTTDLGTPSKAAVPTAAEKAKAEQLKEKQSRVQQGKTKALSSEPRGTKPADKKTIRGSKENASKLTQGELEKLRRAGITPPDKNR